MFFVIFLFHRVQTLKVLLSPYFYKKKRVLIHLVGKAHYLLRSVCIASLCMDGMDIWMVGNALYQCILKCYYLINTLWQFTVNAYHYIRITTDPACIFNSCIALNKILHFIKDCLCRVGDKDVDCHCCLLTLKQQLVFYIKLFQKVKRLKLDSHLSTLFKHSVTQPSLQTRLLFINAPTISHVISPGSLIKFLLKKYPL